MKRVFGIRPIALLLAAAWAMALQPLAALPHEVNLQAYATRNVDRYLVPNFPTGEFVPPLNNFGVPFFIPPGDKNYFAIENLETPLAIPVGVFGVKKVYTMIQGYGPHTGDKILDVEFKGSGGAYQDFPLIVGAHVRDFFESGFSLTINNTTTQRAFEFIGHGGAYTDNVDTGPRGFYDFDEQEFVLNPSFASQTLESITFTRHTTYGTPFILAITAVDSVAPPLPFYQSTRFWIIASITLATLVIIGVVIAIRRWLDAP